MDVAKFHKRLSLGVPTPEQLRLYEAVDVHGYLDDQPDENRFVATFVLGLYQTYDFQTTHFRTVALVIPQSLDKWVVDQMNVTLERIKANVANWKPEPRALFNKTFVGCVRHLEMGSRVFQIKRPARWVAFGFGETTAAPDWVRNGLIP